MKGRFDLATGRFLLLTTFALAGLADSSEAQIITMSDANSVVQVNTGTQQGMFNWSVDGVNQLNQQWFWYRVGAGGPQFSIDTISPAGIAPQNASSVFTTYANAQLSVEVDYTLTGGTAGSGQSGMGESITLLNRSSTSLDLHFFQYANFDLLGNPNGDVVQLGANHFGLYNDAFQSKGNLAVSETGVVPGANRGEVNFADVTRNNLNTVNGLALNNNAGPFGPTNATWALEWDLTIGPGQSQLISKTLSISIVPEPGVLALVSLGLAAFGLRKRGRPVA